jgi:zinc protease
MASGEECGNPDHLNWRERASTGERLKPTAGGADKTAMSSIAPAPATTSIGGVRVFHAPVDGAVRAALTFRVGWADETLATHGLSHLVEHLVLAPLGQPTFDWNGATSADRTTFYCQGSDEQAAWFLNAVTANIRNLPLQHLDVERRILRTEACHRSGGLGGLHDLWRWGAQGYGLGGYDEYGLAFLPVEAIRGWAERFLTAENACLWTTGSLPTELALPRGEPRLQVAPDIWRATPMPSRFVADVQTVSFSAELRVGQWAGLVAWLLEQRLMSRLRYGEGLAYGVHHDVSDAGQGLRRVLVSIDGLPESLPAVALGALAVLNTLANEGPTPRELQRFSEMYRDAGRGELAVVAELARLADSALSGQPMRTAESILDELDALTPEVVAGSITGMAATMLWCAPAGVMIPGVPIAPLGSSDRVQGSRFTPPIGQLQTTYLEVSADGITWVEEKADQRATIRWPECTAAVGYDDGSRILFGRDGFRIALFPERWARFEELRKYVDIHLPVGVWAPQGAAPERRKPAPIRTAKPPTSSGVWILLSVAVWLLALMCLGISVDAGFHPGTFGSAVALAALGCLPVVHVVRRRTRRRAGLELALIRRYRGVRVWPTWLVITGGVASVVAVPLGFLAHIFFWPGFLGAVICGVELARRHRRRL